MLAVDFRTRHKMFQKNRLENTTNHEKRRPNPSTENIAGVFILITKMRMKSFGIMDQKWRFHYLANDSLFYINITELHWVRTLVIQSNHLFRLNQNGEELTAISNGLHLEKITASPKHSWIILFSKQYYYKNWILSCNWFSISAVTFKYISCDEILHYSSVI